MTPRILATTATLVTAVLLAHLAIAQYALDNNLAVNAGRVNPTKAPINMGAEVYSVNYSTGEMQYNRANAFSDPLYSGYQRYTLDRNRYFAPGPLSTRSVSSPQQTYDSVPTPGFSKPKPRHPSQGTTSIVKPTYTPAGAKRVSSVVSPTYSPGAQRIR